MLNVRRVMSSPSQAFEIVPHDPYSSEATMCEDCDDVDEDETDQPLLDTLYAEDTIATPDDYVALVKAWQARRAESGASFLVLHCNLLGQEAQILRQRYCLRRNMAVQIVYLDVPLGTRVDLDASPWKETWRDEMKERVKTTHDPTVVFLGNVLLNGSATLQDLTLDDVLLMYVPTIFAEFYAHSLSALMNSLHTFTPFLERSSTRKVKAPAPECCLQNAVTHSQRRRVSERDQALYDSANLVATQLYNGVSSHFGPRVCLALEDRAGAKEELRIGLDHDTVPFHNLYVARGGEVSLRRAMGGDADAFEIVCWTAFGHPAGGEFVAPGLLYKFHTGQGSTVLFRPHRYFHATLPAHNRDAVNEKFAVALLS